MTEIKEPEVVTNTVNKDSGDILFCVCGVLSPLIGGLLWLIWKDSENQKERANSKQALKGALISFALLAIAIFFYILIFALIIADSATTIQTNYS